MLKLPNGKTRFIDEVRYGGKEQKHIWLVNARFGMKIILPQQTSKN